MDPPPPPNPRMSTDGGRGASAVDRPIAFVPTPPTRRSIEGLDADDRRVLLHTIDEAARERLRSYRVVVLGCQSFLARRDLRAKAAATTKPAGR